MFTKISEAIPSHYGYSGKSASHASPSHDHSPPHEIPSPHDQSIPHEIPPSHSNAIPHPSPLSHDDTLSHHSPPHSLPRTIFLIDMNSYFATCEQQANPLLRGKPIGVGGSNLKRTVVTACSYEAKRYGVKNGMSVPEARQLCPHLLMVVGEPERYTHTTMKFLKIFQDYSPLLEIFSIDEAFLDVTETRERFGGEIAMAREIKRRIQEEIGEMFTCSIGISYNKSLAKLAAGQMKPDGLVMVKKHLDLDDLVRFYAELGETKGRLLAAQDLLNQVKLTDLCGIGEKIAAHLLNMGIASVRELAGTPPHRLRKHFGVYGLFLHALANGEDQTPVVPYWEEDPYRSMGHHYTIPRDVTSREELEPLLLKLSEKAGRRLRLSGYMGKTVHLLLRDNRFQTMAQQHTLSHYIDDGYLIYQAACQILDHWIAGVPSANFFTGDRQTPISPAGGSPPTECQPPLSNPMGSPTGRETNSPLRRADGRLPWVIRMVGVSVSQLVKQYQQLSLLPAEEKRWKVTRVMDQVNNRYGEFTLQRAKILETRLKVHVGGYLEDRSGIFRSFAVAVRK